MKIEIHNIYIFQMSVIHMDREKEEVYYLLITFPQYQSNMCILIVNINVEYIVSNMRSNTGVATTEIIRFPSFQLAVSTFHLAPPTHLIRLYNGNLILVTRIICTLFSKVIIPVNMHLPHGLHKTHANAF